MKIARHPEPKAETFHEKNYESQTSQIESNDTFSYSDGNSFSSVSVIHEDIDKFQYDFAKSFLYAVYQKKFNYPNFKVNKYFTLANHYTPTALPVYISEVIDGMCLIENSVIISHITYKKHSYFITIYSYVCTFQNEMSWKISVTGETSESQAARPLFDFILAESVAHSYYKNKFLKPIKDSNKDSDDIKYFRVEFADIGNTSLNNIFLNDTVRNELDRFIYCIKNFETIKTPLRYLLSGVPGTAKTQIIKAIANECKGKATFMFSHGGDDRINMLFRFSSLFNPCVICIDDIDFLVESRNNIKTSALSDFLQHMDGFVTKNLFVIATTNDKKLVDYAASRPGRFDMILDIGNISSSNYLDLVKQSTNHESIINLFNEEVLTLLNSKRVTGSFIVNLVKQIKIKLAMQNTLGLNEQLDVKTLITSAHKGFYQTSKSETIGFGFDGN